MAAQLAGSPWPAQGCMATTTRSPATSTPGHEQDGVAFRVPAAVGERLRAPEVPRFLEGLVREAKLLRQLPLRAFLLRRRQSFRPDRRHQLPRPGCRDDRRIVE